MVHGNSKAVRVALKKQMIIEDYKLIRKYHEEKKWEISTMCKILEISRAAYYKWLNRKPTENELININLLEKIKSIYNEHKGALGQRKMYGEINKPSEINQNGAIRFNHKRIARLMSVEGLYSQFRKSSGSTWKKSTPEETAENILNREFNAKKPNEKWATDVTEDKIDGTNTKVYLSTILDLHDRVPVALVINTRNDVRLVNDTFYMAYALNPDASPLVHSDRGFQYTRKPFKKMLEEHGSKQSMSRVGRCIDNGVCEGFQGLIKELIHIRHPRIKTVEEYKMAAYETYNYYIENYPQERFNWKSAGEVRREALSSEEVIEYPIKPNRRIERYWEHIEELKKSHATQAA